MQPEDVESGELLRAGSAGDESAVKDLLVRHLPELRAFVRMRVDPVLRQCEGDSDFVQSVCLDVIRAADRFEFRGESAFRNWLYGAVLNKVRERRDHWLAAKRDLRRSQPLPAGHDGDPSLALIYSSAFSPAGAAIRAEDVARLERAIAELPETAREVLTLHRFVGLSHAEIAAQIGRTEGATRQVLHSALAKLAVALTGG